MQPGGRYPPPHATDPVRIHPDRTGPKTVRAAFDRFDEAAEEPKRGSDEIHGLPSDRSVSSGSRAIETGSAVYCRLLNV